MRRKSNTRGGPAKHRGLRALPPPLTNQPQLPRQQPMIPQEDSPFYDDRHIEGHLDLNRYLIKHPVATFYVHVSGDSMTGAGIPPDSILVVDRAVKADDGDIVIARINDELCVKRLRRQKGRLWLYPENDKYQPVEIIEGMDFEVWGRVMYAIRSY